MKTVITYLVILLLTAGCSVAPVPVKIIFDTDFGGDADDLGALVMLHNLMDHGECDLLAVMCWSTEQYAIPAIDAVNRWYNHPGIPLGVRKEGSHAADWNYNRAIASALPHEISQSDATDATELYRKILSGSEDQSIVLLTVGPLKNIQNLIESPPDQYSELSGKALLEKKIKEVVIMGGRFPEGDNEWNFDGGMPGVTRYVLDNLNTPVTFSGFEVGVQIKTGVVFNDTDPGSPLHIGFLHFSEHAPWINTHFKGEILDNSSFDQTGVLYAVRNGVGEYWDRIEDGQCLAGENGSNEWVEGAVSDHSYLKLTMDPEEMANLLESLMLNEF